MAVKKEPVAPAPVVSDKKKALETAMQQIEKMYGKGSIMRYGAESTLNVESIPTGSLSLDLALGIGGLRYGGGIKAVYYNPLRRGGYAADGAGRFKKNYGAAANAVHKAKHKIEYFIRAVRGKQQRVKLIKPCGALRA